MRKTVLLWASMATALMLAGGVVLVAPIEQAEAAFPGTNGKIAFQSDRVTPENPTGERKEALRNPSVQVEQGPDRPNILFIMSDDQDAASLEYMPNYKALIREQGKTYTEATFSDPLCCPSRASMLRGQYPPNTGIWTNSRSHNPAGGEVVFRNRGLDNSTMATSLDAVGYRPALIGKYMNQYGAAESSTPEGWGYWYAKVGNHAVRVDPDGDGGKPSKLHPIDGMPDAQNNSRTEAFIRNQEGREPWMVWDSYKAPHPGCEMAKGDENTGDLPLPKPPNYDEQDVTDKPQWVRDKAPVTDAEEEAQHKFYRKRIECLQTLDRGIAQLVRALEETGQYDNTYIVFWTDNGFHFGNHGLNSAKKAPYEEDINVPLTIVGPGIPANTNDDALISNVDLAPTFDDIGGATPTGHVQDGQSFLADARGEAEFSRNRQLIESKKGTNTADAVPDYKIVREDRWKLIRYGDGFRELYDLEADPYELENVAADSANAAILTDLEAKLNAMQVCDGPACAKVENAP
jgi:N-acetylglucosamine-6-sulfatase